MLITQNEESNLPRTLASVRSLVADGRGEIIVVDSGSTDRTCEIAASFGARVIHEAWRGFSSQKNFALDQAHGDWILSLDADEALEPELADAIARIVANPNVGEEVQGYYLHRKNHFLGRWMRHGGYWPDPKLRLFRRGAGRFEARAVHESLQVTGLTASITRGAILHWCYPTISDYIEHMNRYSTLGAEMVVSSGKRLGMGDIVARPLATFLYNYIVRGGFLDGHEGFLQHMSHAVYVCWKYAKAWERQR